MAEKQPDEPAKLIINGREHEFPEQYDLGEARMLKKLCGVYLSETSTLRIDDPDWITFTVWVMLHRADPTVTVEQVEELNLDPIIEQLVDILNQKKEEDEGDDGRPPDETPGEPSEKPGRSSESAPESGKSSTGTSPETPPETSGEPS